MKNNLDLLSNENEQLKQQLNEIEENNHLLMNNNQNLTNRLYQYERPSSPFVSQDNFKQIRRTPIQDVCFHFSFEFSFVIFLFRRLKFIKFLLFNLLHLSEKKNLNNYEPIFRH